MLYQPTNVTPSMLGEIGNGTVDVSNDMTVQWQINGNSPMVGFRLYIYLNNAANTLKYDSQYQTENCPFYGKNYLGENQLFSYTIPASTLAQQGITNGNSYKLVIRQYWTETDFTEQTSPAAFLARSTPSLEYNRSAGWYRNGTVTTKSAAFTADYSQAQGDALNWVRWQLQMIANLQMNSNSAYVQSVAYDTFSGAVRNEAGTYTFLYTQRQWQAGNGETSTDLSGYGITYSGTPQEGDEVTVWWNVAQIVYDSGNLYGVQTLRMTYDGFLPNARFSINCTAQTQNGVTQEAGWVPFDVVYNVSRTEGICSACKAAGKSAIQVSWPSAFPIEATYSGAPQVRDGILVLPNRATYVKWSAQGGGATIPAPWTICLRGTVVGGGGNVNIMRTDTSVKTGACKVSYNESVAPPSISVQYMGHDVVVYLPEGEIPQEVSFSVTITGRYGESRGKILAEITATYAPESGIPPYNGIGGWNDVDSGTLYSGDSITGIVVFGRSRLNVVKVVNSEIGNATTEEFDAGTIMMANFEDGTFNAGMVPGNIGAAKYAVYRRTGNDAVLTHICDANIDATEILDYGAADITTGYTYYVFLVSANTAEYLIGKTPSITPCVRGWTILSCARTQDNLYSIQAEYVFNKNVNSGTISNNNSPGVFPTFARYPNVQLAAPLYKSGTLQGLIGVIDYAGENSYSDTAEMRDAVFELAQTPNTLFLKTRKGELLQISVAAPVVATIMDATAEQAQEVSVPWVETGSAEGAGITGT